MKAQTPIRYSMRTLLLLVALLCALLAIGGIITETIVAARARHAVGGYIRHVHGGEVTYGVDERPGFFKWLREITGGDYHAAITHVKISTSGFTDASIDQSRLVEQLGYLPKLEEIDLTESAATETGAKMLQSKFPNCNVRR